MFGINRKNIWHDRDSNPEPTACEPCCPNPTAFIYFWKKRVGNFGLKKKKTTLLNEYFFLHITYAAKNKKINEKVRISRCSMWPREIQIYFMREKFYLDTDHQALNSAASRTRPKVAGAFLLSATYVQDQVYLSKPFSEISTNSTPSQKQHCRFSKENVKIWTK